MRKAILMAASAAILAFPVSERAQAQSDPRVPMLEQELRNLRAEIENLKKAQADGDLSAALADLKRATGDQYVDINNQLAALPKVGLNDGRLTIATADGRFSIALRGLMQYDMGYFAQGRNGAVADLSSGTNFRRAQIGFTGTAFRDWSYNFTFDFGGNGLEKSGYIYSAYIQYDGFKPFVIRAGAYTPPAGLEDQTGSADLIFLERPSAVDAARNIAGAPSREAVSLLWQDTNLFASVSYTGQKAGDSGAFDEQQAVIGRAAWLAVGTPEVKWLLDADVTHLFKPADIVAGSVPLTTALTAVSLSGTPELAVDNNAPKITNTGNLDVNSVTQFGFESALEYDALFLQGGYFHYRFDRRNPALPDPDFNGWYAAATWSLTGETHPYDASTASFRGLRPARGLGSGGPGAWELKARYSYLDLDHDPLASAAAGGIGGGVQNIWTLGANWYPTNGVRFSLEYSNLHLSHVNAPLTNISADEFGLRTQLAL